DAAALEEAYRFCERARNARYLLTGRPGDSLPTDGQEATRLARLLGYELESQARLRDDYRRVTRRARKVVERVFYGRAGTPATGRWCRRGAGSPSRHRTGSPTRGSAPS